MITAALVLGFLLGALCVAGLVAFWLLGVSPSGRDAWVADDFELREQLKQEGRGGDAGRML